MGEIAKFEYGFTDTAKDSGEVRFVRITDIDETGKLSANDEKFVNLTKEAQKFLLKKGDIIVARTGATYGKTAVFNESYPAVFASYLIRIQCDPNILDPHYYWLFAQSSDYWIQAKQLVSGGGQPQFNANAIKKLNMPLPPLKIQKQLVAEAKKEEEIIAANRRLIEIMEEKIAAVLRDI